MSEPSTERLVRILRSRLTPYWKADITAITSKLLATQLSGLYEKLEWLSRDMRSESIINGNEINVLRQNLNNLRELLEEKGILASQYEITERERNEAIDIAKEVGTDGGFKEQ